MFHGATSATEGGKSAHADSAELLGKINAEFTAKLVAQGIPAETVSEWMGEGRMGWLNAGEAKAYGIIDSITGEAESEPAMVALDIAACLEKEGVCIPENAKETAAISPAEITAKLTADHATAVAEIMAKHAAEIGKRDALATKLQSEKDKATASVARLEKLLNETTAKLEKLTAGALGFVPAAEIATWADALRACKGDYVAARRAYPVLFQSTLKRL
jgi:lambda repressor-like predicted transcriptional regulator